MENNNNKKRRTRFVKHGIVSHWDDFTQRVEATFVTSRLVVRATPAGKRINYSFAK
jgi:hypothetical protein